MLLTIYQYRYKNSPSVKKIYEKARDTGPKEESYKAGTLSKKKLIDTSASTVAAAKASTHQASHKTGGKGAASGKASVSAGGIVRYTAGNDDQGEVQSKASRKKGGDAVNSSAPSGKGKVHAHGPAHQSRKKH